MATRTAVDRQRLRETHELHLLNEASAPVQARGRGQLVLKPPSSFTGPPSSVGPSLLNQVNQCSSEPSVESVKNDIPKVGLEICFVHCSLLDCVVETTELRWDCLVILVFPRYVVFSLWVILSPPSVGGK